MMIRKVTALLCAGLLTAGLAGCSSAAGEADEGSGPVTLTYGIWDANQQPAMQKIVDAFQATHPDIKVNVQLTPNADYWTKLQTAASAGSAPDVFWMSSTRVGLYAGQGQLLPLTGRDGFDASKFSRALNDIYTVGGKQYGMPKDYDTVGLWYNKQLFDAAGLKYPDASWTWQSVIDASQKLTDPAKGVWGIASPSWTQENLYNTVHQAGGSVISADRKRSGLADPASIEGLRYALDFVTRYRTSPTAQQMADTDPSQLFASGKVAMFADGDWNTLTYKNAPGLVAGVAPLPAGPKGRATVVNGLGNVIYAKTKHPKAAWEFVRYLGGREANEVQAATGTVIPAYEGLADTWVKSTPQFDLRIFVDQLQNAVPYPVSKNTSAWSKDTQALLDKVWAGQQDLDSAAKQMAATMDAALAKE
ncbi:ABC transporter substrate-binding protein [Kitasatospora sp. NPDC096147]|uniref:ABC transporter substrate-binding protein n=1 Tax=Kitasatospora sp. NPDC096147 TaxID=3364093 RepID=UPI00381B7B5A